LSRSSERDRLQRALEAHHDIRTDFVYIRNCSIWIRDNYHDLKVIPIPIVNGQELLLRGLYLDALLILYRKCFVSGQRGGLDSTRFDDVLGPLKTLHENGLLARANQLTAHAVSASAATTIKVMGGKAMASTVRPGHNKFDFDNLILVTETWLPFVEAEIARLTQEFEALLDPGEDEGSDFFMAPWGSGIDIQALRTGRPAARTRRQLETGPGKDDE
jgi:hypothetical protein